MHTYTHIINAYICTWTNTTQSTYTRPQCAEKEKDFNVFLYSDMMMKCIRCYGKEVLCYIE